MDKESPKLLMNVRPPASLGSLLRIASLVLIIVVLISASIRASPTLPLATNTHSITTSDTMSYTSGQMPWLKVSGSKILDRNNNTFIMKGVNYWLGADRIDLDFGWFGYAPIDWTNFFTILKNSGFNSVRFGVAADNLLEPIQGSSNYLTNIQTITQIAYDLDIVVLWELHVLLNLDAQYHYPGGYTKTGGTSSGNPFLPESADATVIPDAQTFINALIVLANTIKDYPNTCLEIYNEPSFGVPLDQTSYDNYFANLPSAIQTVRGTGFDGLIFIMGGMAFLPGWAASPEMTMAWAIDHSSLFDGTVVADLHIYRYFTGASSFPDDYDQMRNLFLNNGKIAQAKQLNIPIIFGEIGVMADGGNVLVETNAVINLIQFCVEQELGFVLHSPCDFDDFRLFSSMSLFQWNSIGVTLAAAVSSL